MRNYFLFPLKPLAKFPEFIGKIDFWWDFWLIPVVVFFERFLVNFSKNSCNAQWSERTIWQEKSIFFVLIIIIISISSRMTSSEKLFAMEIYIFLEKIGWCWFRFLFWTKYLVWGTCYCVSQQTFRECYYEQLCWRHLLADSSFELSKLIHKVST